MNTKYIGISQWKFDQAYDNFCHYVMNNTYDKIIFFGQCEYEYYFDDKFKYLIDLCESRNNPLHVITAGVDWETSWEIPKLKILKNKNFILHKWGTYWFVKAFGELCRYDTRRINDDDNLSYEYHYISMNNRMHMHRCMFVDLLAKNDLIKYGAVSVHLNEIKNLGENKHWIRDYPWRYFKPTESLILDQQYVNRRNQALLPEQYYNSFMQVVSETAANGIFLTEKTATPLIMGKPFLVVSERGFYKFLTDLGFQLYDELFDYSFDTVADRATRYSMLLENVVKISKLEKSQLPKLYQTIKHKVEFNKSVAKKIILDNTLRPSISNEIFEHYEQTGQETDIELIATLCDFKKYKDFNY